MLFQTFPGAHAEVSGAIRACSSTQLRSHMQALNSTRTWQPVLRQHVGSKRWLCRSGFDGLL